MHPGAIVRLDRSLGPEPSNSSSAHQVVEFEVEIDWISLFRIIEDISIGLDYIHRNGTVHRDLKPHNSINPFLFGSAHHSFVLT